MPPKVPPVCNADFEKLVKLGFYPVFADHAAGTLDQEFGR